MATQETTISTYSSLFGQGPRGICKKTWLMKAKSRVLRAYQARNQKALLTGAEINLPDGWKREFKHVSTIGVAPLPTGRGKPLSTFNCLICPDEVYRQKCRLLEPFTPIYPVKSTKRLVEIWP